MMMDILMDSCLDAMMITGPVIVMMMMIELVNVRSAGTWFASIERSPVRQILLGAVLGVIPGCLGGFAAVSLYSHRIISFGALVACMICSSGDESFVMLAMFPGRALLLTGLLFILSVPIGMLTDSVRGRFVSGRFHGHVSVSPFDDTCTHTFEIHAGPDHGERPSIWRHGSLRTLKHPSRLRILTAVCLVLYAAALLTGVPEHGHGHDHGGHGLNFLDERWMNILFGVLTLVSAFFVLVAEEHFLREHLWEHVIKHHLVRIFLWTFGTLLFINILLQHADAGAWVGDNIWCAILIASLVGIIPESGPHLVFVTLFATGALPFSVLLASSMSQDGHTALPLLASTKKGFICAKGINALAAVTVGCAVHLFFGC